MQAGIPTKKLDAVTKNSNPLGSNDYLLHFIIDALFNALSTATCKATESYGKLNTWFTTYR